MAELCTERGVDELEVTEITRRARTDTETFYNLFVDLEDCLVASTNAVTAQVLSEVSSSYSADLTEWDSGLLGIKAILELMAAQPSFAYLGYVVSRQTAPPRVQEIYRGAARMLTMMIERLWRYSELEVQPRRAARAALGACEAVVRAEIVAGRAEQLPRLLPDLAYGASVPFLGQEEARRLAKRGRELLSGTEWEQSG
jgi:hypothetical protein